MPKRSGVIERKPIRPIGTGAHVLVPKDWRGDYVKVIRLSEEDQEREEGADD